MVINVFNAPEGLVFTVKVCVQANHKSPKSGIDHWRGDP